jgi:hypothetical protein
MKSDAIDSDFSDGKIKSSNFREILGDAIDTSGSKISLTNIFADEIGDKAISAGEESLLKLNNITIKNSKIGIASKDKSKVIGNYIEIKNCGLYDVAAYQKKSFYGGGYIDLKKTSTCNMSLVQEGSNIKLNNEILKSYSFDIKKIYN